MWLFLQLLPFFKVIMKIIFPNSNHRNHFATRLATGMAMVRILVKTFFIVTFTKRLRRKWTFSSTSGVDGPVAKTIVSELVNQLFEFSEKCFSLSLWPSRKDFGKPKADLVTPHELSTAIYNYQSISTVILIMSYVCVDECDNF